MEMDGWMDACMHTCVDGGWGMDDGRIDDGGMS